ncbi:MAG: glycerate kinase [Elusimicrobia bacterium]|nr:glycerate kinase [Elusimicrobiota bacterium]
MKILIAPNPFKGSISAPEAAAGVRDGLIERLPDADIRLVPVSDGGDGLIDALTHKFGGKIFYRKVRGPLGKPVKARCAFLDSRTAVIEMAEASGIKYLKPSRYDCMSASTCGVGELIEFVLKKGVDKILIGLGGSASNDAGAGCAQGFGIKLLDRRGRNIESGVNGLLNLHSVDFGRTRQLLRRAKITGLVDVRNPLCGRYGSARIFGPQKGASSEQVKIIEKALLHCAEVVKKELGKDIGRIKGGAAAGGLGAGLVAFFNARLEPGSEYVISALGLEQDIQWADVVITGEGKFDEMSFYGKAPAAVAKTAKKYGKPVILVCAGTEITDVHRLKRAGIMKVIALEKIFKNRNLFLNTRLLIKKAFFTGKNDII